MLPQDYWPWNIPDPKYSSGSLTKLATFTSQLLERLQHQSPLLPLLVLGSSCSLGKADILFSSHFISTESPVKPWPHFWRHLWNFLFTASAFCAFPPRLKPEVPTAGCISVLGVTDQRHTGGVRRGWAWGRLGRVSPLLMLQDEEPLPHPKAGTVKSAHLGREATDSYRQTHLSAGLLENTVTNLNTSQTRELT